MPAWLKYTIAGIIGYLFGTGVLTFVGIAHGLQAFFNSLNFG